MLLNYMKSIKKSFSKISHSNKSNTWFIILAVGALFVVLYYFLGKRFGLREGQETSTDSATDGSNSAGGVSDSTGGVSDIADGGSDGATGGDTAVPNATGGGRGGGGRGGGRGGGDPNATRGGRGTVYPNATSGGRGTVYPNATSGGRETTDPNATSGGRETTDQNATIVGSDTTVSNTTLSNVSKVSKEPDVDKIVSSGSSGENVLLSNIQNATQILQNERLSQQKAQFDKVVTDEEHILASMQTTLKNIEDKTDKTHAIFKRQMTRPMAKSKDTTPKKSTSNKVVVPKNDLYPNDE
jgi:hypothetical protein